MRSLVEEARLPFGAGIWPCFEIITAVGETGRLLKWRVQVCENGDTRTLGVSRRICWGKKFPIFSTIISGTAALSLGLGWALVRDSNKRMKTVLPTLEGHLTAE